MKDEESAAPEMTAAAVRRWFTAAAWGSAIAWPLLMTALAPLVMWWLDIGWDEALTADFAAAGLLPLVLVTSYFCCDAVRTVRKEQEEVTQSAVELVAAVRSGDPSDLPHAARHFGNTLLRARSAFNTRVLPRRATLRFARRVVREAEAAQLSAASLRAVRELARVDA
ncbi:hypothetical protein AB0393_28150 [Streptomyces cyaneofuscatus]|uniref:hypothetical protein n=1 Tax=Streptomyces cyaneofuscatus TaxID=66883 RepID=UPI00344D05A3